MEDRAGTPPHQGGAEEPFARLDAAARRVETPCGDGTMVWRVRGEGEPLVLLHGGTGSWRHWVRNIEPLAAAGRRILAPDLPGPGESAMAPGEPGPAAIAEVVAAGLDRLLGPEARCDLAGFSFGAVVSGHVAAARPGRPRSVTLVGAGALGVPRGRTDLVKVRDKAGAERIAAHRANLAALMIADPARIDDLAVAIQEWNTVHARYRSRVHAQTALLRDALERALARAPEMALNGIWGERDQVAWPHVADRLAVLRALQPEADVRLIEGAGHWVAYEAPERFDAALLDMLRRRGGGTPQGGRNAPIRSTARRFRRPSRHARRGPARWCRGGSALGRGRAALPRVPIRTATRGRARSGSLSARRRCRSPRSAAGPRPGPSPSGGRSPG